MRALIAAALVLALTGCPGGVKPTPKVATVIEKPVKVYVPIPDELRERCTWPKAGKPSEAIEVARKRKECLQQYEGQLDGIDKVQGQAVP